MGRYTGKSCRLLCMIGLTASFFLVEIIVGYMTNSLALVGDAYHMLSDVIALIVGIASVRIAKWRSRKNTYGWARAEVLGALINAVFLIALCFTIFIEALQRMVKDDHIHQPDLMLIVGGIGLGINVIGLALFGTHSHSHGGHGHSHGGHGHSHFDDGAAKKDDDSPTMDISTYDPVKISEAGSSNGDVIPHNPDDSDAIDDVDVEIEEITRSKMKSSAQLNMRGVFLHVMGDALGSVIVIISALVIKYVDAEWRFKIDPAMSLVLVAIILSTSIPLLKESALILLQTVPTHIQVQDLQKRLVNKVQGVIAVHEFHIWQLAGNRIIASAHIHCQNLRDYMRIAEEVKLFFHNEGIHSTTIQPEFVETSPSIDKDCILPCDTDCNTMQCCHDDLKVRKAPSVFKNCYRRKRDHSDTLTEVMIGPDENEALMAGRGGVNSIAMDTGQTVPGLSNMGHMEVNGGQMTEPNGDTTEMSEVEAGMGQSSGQNITASPGSNHGDLECEPGGDIPRPILLDTSDLDTDPPISHSLERGHPRSYSEPRRVLPSSGDAPSDECHTLPRRQYQPKFYPRTSLPNRPLSMYDMPRSSDPKQTPRKTQSTDALRAIPGEENIEPGEESSESEESSGTTPRTPCDSLIDGDTSIASVPTFTASEANIDQAIKRLKHDLRTIRGDAASRESFLDQ